MSQIITPVWKLFIKNWGRDLKIYKQRKLLYFTWIIAKLPHRNKFFFRTVNGIKYILDIFIAMTIYVETNLAHTKQTEKKRAGNITVKSLAL